MLLGGLAAVGWWADRQVVRISEGKPVEWWGLYMAIFACVMLALVGGPIGMWLGILGLVVIALGAVYAYSAPLRDLIARGLLYFSDVATFPAPPAP